MAPLSLVVAACAVASVSAGHLRSGADVPQQIHLAYAGATSGTGMSVVWRTNNATSTSTVNYGLAPNKLTSAATGALTSYYNATGWDHTVILTGLTPATTYYYMCGDAAAGWSPVYNFSTAPSAGVEFPFAVAIIGDMGIYNSQNTFMDLPRVTPVSNFIWHIGDISYADDDFLHDPLVDHYEYTWNTYMTDMSLFTATRPYMVLPGNHEAECHSPTCFLDATKRDAFKNFTAFNNRFRMPSPESNGTLNMWYSFDYGGVHFLNIDTETDYPGAPNDDYSSQNGNFGNQIAWVQADLARAAARRAAGEISWIIVGGHRPLYSRASCDANGVPSGEAAATQAAFEPLFHQFGVDLYFCGHEHSVEAGWPVYNNTVVQSYDRPPYTVYVVAGASGCDEGHTSYASSPVTAWNRYSNDQDYGLSMLYVTNSTSLTWQFRRGSDGTVLDSFTITK